MADLERFLQEHSSKMKKNLKKATKSRKFLVAEGIYMNSMEICPLPELVKLRSKYELRYFLDESISFSKFQYIYNIYYIYIFVILDIYLL